MTRFLSGRRRGPGSRPSRDGRRGMMLVEMVVTIGLIAVTAAMASRLLIALLTTGRELNDADREARALDAVVATLRRDVERATNVVATADGVTLRQSPADGAVTWESREATLVRRENGHQVRLGPVPAELATVEADGGRVVLRVDDAAWAFRPIVEGGDR